MNLASLQIPRSNDAKMYHKLLLARTALASQQAPWYSHVPMGMGMRCAPSSAFNVRPLTIPRATSPSGLDLLRSVSMRLPNTVAPRAPLASQTSLRPVIATSKPPSPMLGAMPDSEGKFYIDEVRETDVLCGRGGKSNHHLGNKRYRQVVSEMKIMYRSTEAKKGKTGLSRAIVDHVCEYGGRFVKKDGPTGRYYVLSKAEARKKTSQALRETKALKWTN